MATEIEQNKAESSMNELWMRALEPKPPAKPKMSAADKAKNRKLAVLYTKLMWKREYILKKDLNRKMLLKWAALYALPTDELKREALVVDAWMPTLKIPRMTPPLAGFQGPEARAEEEAAAKKETERAGATAGKGKAGPAGKQAGGAAARKGRGQGGGGIDLAALSGLTKIAEAPPSTGGGKGQGKIGEPEAGTGSRGGKR